MVITIVDNEIGMALQEVEALNLRLQDYNEEMETADGGTSIGLINIQKRIKLRYGEDFGIKIFSRLNGGTVVELKIGKIE